MSDQPTTTAGEPIDLLAALNTALGRAKDDPRVYTSTNAYDRGPDEPPDIDFDEDYEADRAAERYERHFDDMW